MCLLSTDKSKVKASFDMAPNYFVANLTRSLGRLSLACITTTTCTQRYWLHTSRGVAVYLYTLLSNQPPCIIPTTTIGFGPLQTLRSCQYVSSPGPAFAGSISPPCWGRGRKKIVSGDLVSSLTFGRQAMSCHLQVCCYSLVFSLILRWSLQTSGVYTNHGSFQLRVLREPGVPTRVHLKFTSVMPLSEMLDSKDPCVVIPYYLTDLKIGFTSKTYHWVTPMCGRRFTS